jgi:predicted metal-binding protein
MFACIILEDRWRINKVTKIGIIRCNENSINCAGFTCFPSMAKKSGEFAQYDTIELVGFDTCGGYGLCKSDKIVAKALRLKEKGAEVIHLGDCMIGACPNKDKNIAALKEQVGLPIIERTHGPH